MRKKIDEVISSSNALALYDSRRAQIDELAKYILAKIKNGSKAHLNFICTHNSRRSQLAQVWGQALADFLELPIRCYSGGVEVTAFNPRAIKALESDGYVFSVSGRDNPIFSMESQSGKGTYQYFSKTFDDPANPKSDFAAVMTCDHADLNCPFIPGAEVRIPLRYEDPKLFDDTLQESEMYLQRSHQIAAELLFYFQQVKRALN